MYNNIALRKLRKMPTDIFMGNPIQENTQTCYDSCQKYSKPKKNTNWNKGYPTNFKYK